MRELLYVSDRKLKAFVDEGRSMRLPKLSGEGEISFLAALKLKFSVAGDNATSDEMPEKTTLRELLKRVDRVVGHLETQERPPLWFEDESVREGGWIQFEGGFAWAYQGETFIVWTADINALLDN